MPERTTPAHRWPEGILRSGRAAAFLTLASGINGTMAALVHGWEPRWLYVAVVGVIAALDGWVVGLAAAAGAVICYQLMSFGSLNLAPDRDAFLLGAAMVAAIAARAMRVSIARPRLAAPKAPPLLTGMTAVAVEVPGDPAAAAALRDATDALRKALDDERARTERERVRRQEEEERSRVAIDEIAAELRRSKIALDELQQQHEDLQQRHAAVEEDLGRAEAAGRVAAERVADYERSHEQLRSIVRDAEALRDAAEKRVAYSERSAEEIRGLLEHTQMLQQASDDRAAEIERSNGQLREALDDLTVSRDAAAARAADLENALAELTASSAIARQQSDERTAALQKEIAGLHAALEHQRFRLEAEWNEKLARNAVELTDRFNATLLDSDARADVARGEAQRHATRVGELEREIAAARASAGDQLAAIETEWQQRLQSRITEVTGIHNRAIIDADERTAAALAEARRLSEQVAELESQIAAVQASAGEQRATLEAEWQRKVQETLADVTEIHNRALLDAGERTAAALREANKITARVAELESERARLRSESDRAATLGVEAEALAVRAAELQIENEHLRARSALAESMQDQMASLAARVQELEAINEQLQNRQSAGSGAIEEQAHTLTARVAELEAEAEMLRRIADQQRARSEAEWSGKFARSAMEITQHFQGELSDASARTAAAEAEAHRLAERVRDLEHEQIESRAAFDAERATLEADWNAKLQTIVAHLASDHEADLGQATLEREEARAEARMLAMKLSQIEVNVRDMSDAYDELRKRDEALRREADVQRRNAEAQKQQGNSREAEWNARLAANALELTQRFNGAMAAADSRLQQANRDAENLASRVRELEQIIAGLRTSDEERRAAIDAEWGEKLQTIVNHLANDHEADIGQALIDKEEARAEARMYSSRLVALQKTLEDEREAQGKSNTDWIAERAELLGTIDSLRRRLGIGTSAGATPLPPPPGTRTSVVVVHRDAAVRAITRHALESSGYDVITAADGLEAFRVTIAQRPAVVLAEVQMPKMDGRALVQMLKSRPETAGVKIVLMSATAENGERPAGEFHADDFLSDPANIEALKTTLANVLGLRA